MEERLEKILEIKVDVGEAIKGIDSLNAAVAEQKKRQQELKEQIKQLEEAEGDNTDAIAEMREAYILSQQKVKDYNSQIQSLSKSVQNQLKIDRENIGSMQQLRAQLSNLTKAYDSLSAEEREAAKGQELKDKINEVTDALKNSEEATQRYYRNVGNYENAIKNSLGLNSKFANTLNQINQNGIGATLNEMSQGVKNVGKETTKLLANPIVATLALIAAAVMAVVKGIKSSEENTAKWSATMAKFKPFLDVVTVACQKFASVMLDLVGWFGKATGSIMKWLEKLPLVGDNIAAINAESERYQQIAKETYQIDVDRRKLEEESADAALKVSELRTKAKDKERYTDEERLKFVQQANEVERKIAEEKVALAERALKAAEEEAKATQNQKEVEEKLSQLRIAVKNERKAYFDKSRELYEQENTIKNEILAKDKARADEARKLNDEKIKQQKEYNEALEEAYQETQDMLIELISDSVAKEEELERTRYERQIEAIKKKQEQYDEEDALYQEYALQLELAAQQHAANMQQIGIDQRMKEADERALEWENRIEEARQNGEDYKALTLEMLETQLAEMTQMQGESDAEYKARQLALKDEILTIKKEQADAEMAIEKAKSESIAGLLGDVAGAIEAVAGENKAAVKASKMLALAEVAIKQGVAIAEAVAMSTKGDPYTYAIRVATAIATTISSMAGAIKSINSVKLARGGYVNGPGTSTSDSVPAMLSNGEFVVNARATSMFPNLLETINNFGLGIASPARLETAYQARQEAMTLDMMVKAFKQLPRPVVSVEEYSRVENRVDTLENLTRL